MDEDTPNHQNSLFSLHLAADIAAKCPPACFDVPRCQRGGKRALQSSTGSGDYVIDGRRPRFFDCRRVQPVMPGDRAVNPKWHWSGFRRELRQPNRALPSVDPSFINVCRLRHAHFPFMAPRLLSDSCRPSDLCSVPREAVHARFNTINGRTLLHLDHRIR